MSKLLPCPFCGSDARMWPSHTKADEDGSYEIIGCSNVECLIEPTTEEYLPYDEALKRWNTRAAPTQCDELETVAHRAKYISELEHQWRYYRSADSGFDPTKYEEQPLVTRQNAEEVIAAKDARIAEYETGLVQMHQEMSALEADNKRLREALGAMLIPFEDSNCRHDHHGHCQEHFLEEDCCVAKARAALGKVKQ